MSDTVIILQDECILAAEGKEGRTPKVSQVFRIPVDSYGDSVEQWKKALSKYNEEHHPDRVKLVLPVNYSTARMTQIPYVSGKQLSNMAHNVMLENGIEGMADYSVVSADKKQGVCLCCGSATEELLKNLADMFEEISLPVHTISVPMEGYLRLLSQLKAYKDQTAIYLLFEENSVTSILYRDGVYHYSTRSRIFSERGTLDFGTEIVRNISGIGQFYSTERDSSPITDVYYAGCADDDFEVCIQGIENMDLKVHPLEINISIDGKEKAEDYLACIGGMITDKKNINLYEKWLESQKQEVVHNIDIRKEIVFPLLTFAFCLVAFAGVTVWNVVTSTRISRINDWIYDDQNQSAYQQANERQIYSQKLGSAISQVDQMTENLSTYPDLTDKMLTEIENVSGRDMDVRVQSVDMSTRTLTCNAVSRQVIDIPGYISVLNGTGLFESVDYTGYSYTDGEYSLMLSCVLKAADAGEGE